MKKTFIATCLIAMGASAQAQDSFLNDQLVNTSSDVHGSARFVGMGGAMGALGADISTIAWNPAGLGLMRRSDISITAGGAWSAKGIEEEGSGNATVDHLGLVYAMDFGGDKTQFINFGFSYLKKKDYNNAFYADNNNLNGLSQMNTLVNLANHDYGTEYNLAGLAIGYGNQKLSFIPYDDVKKEFKNPYKSTENFYTQHTSGSLQGFEFNISGNYDDRFYWGITMGLDKLKYRAWSDYTEHAPTPYIELKDGGYSDGSYSVFNDVAIDGMGFNTKLGFIFRPIEDNPLRVALVAETPTWYQLKRSNYYSMGDYYFTNPTAANRNYKTHYTTKEFESYYEYAVRTPFKFRAGIGSTVGTSLAWDIDYEFANYRTTAQGEPQTYVDDPNSSIFNNVWDKDMNAVTRANLKPVHNVRAGVEFRPISTIALRAGYNYTSSAYKKDVAFDQVNNMSNSLDYATSTNFMRLGDAHTICLGLGFRWSNSAYLDMAYKLHAQKGDFYAFDASSQGGKLAPVSTELARHQVTATLGFKF